MDAVRWQALMAERRAADAALSHALIDERNTVCAPSMPIDFRARFLRTRGAQIRASLLLDLGDAVSALPTDQGHSTT